MSGAVPIDAPVRGRLDAEGRLVEADPRLARLHRQAGGAKDGPLAVPQIAELARLASRLGLLVSRQVLAAEGDTDLELTVQAEPDGDDVRLSLSGWREKQPYTPRDEPEAGRPDAYHRAGGDWFWETDRSLRLVSISADARETIGDIGRFVGQPLTSLFRFGDGERDELPILRALAEHERFERQPAALREAPGGLYELSGLPLIDGRGDFAGFRGSVRIVEGAQAAPDDGELSPETIPDALGTQLDRALRAPIDRIVASAESIRAEEDGPLRDDYAEYASDIAQAGRHLLALIGDLSDLQAVEREDFEPRREAIDLAEIARQAAGLLSVRADDKHIRVDAPPEDESLAAIGDYQRVLQILVNLIGNAVRYAPEDSQVWIRSEAEGDLAAVIVADQGRGIAKEDQPRIFEKFERLGASEPGSGLGLYISRRLARAMGGDIDVDSAPGQGARFVLTLPTGEG
ncbi:MAG: sensor histidine kinase [Parasphingopyxis sp.]|nr:HAMP domain-containing histidine kinase [Sphingomonadales bacterium]